MMQFEAWMGRTSVVHVLGLNCQRVRLDPNHGCVAHVAHHHVCDGHMIQMIDVMNVEIVVIMHMTVLEVDAAVGEDLAPELDQGPGPVTGGEVIHAVEAGVGIVEAEV